MCVNHQKDVKLKAVCAPRRSRSPAATRAVSVPLSRQFDLDEPLLRSVTPAHQHPRARIRRVEKLPPPNAVAINPRTRMLKTWKNQGERGYWTAHLSSMAAPEILIVLSLYARSRTRTQGESNPRALTRMNKGECYRSQALHQSWPRKPPASNPLARLREPLPLSQRRWHPGCKARQGAKSRRCGKAGACTSHRQRRCHGSASAKSTSQNLRCCHESASASVPERGQNPNPKSRHQHERASANAARRRKATQTRANVSPAGRRESRRARTSCPLGRDQTLGSWREVAEGANFRVEKAC